MGGLPPTTVLQEGDEGEARAVADAFPESFEFGEFFVVVDDFEVGGELVLLGEMGALGAEEGVVDEIGAVFDDVEGHPFGFDGGEDVAEMFKGVLVHEGEGTSEHAEEDVDVLVVSGAEGEGAEGEVDGFGVEFFGDLDAVVDEPGANAFEIGGLDDAGVALAAKRLEEGDESFESLVGVVTVGGGKMVVVAEIIGAGATAAAVDAVAVAAAVGGFGVDELEVDGVAEDADMGSVVFVDAKGHAGALDALGEGLGELLAPEDGGQGMFVEEAGGQDTFEIAEFGFDVGHESDLGVLHPAREEGEGGKKNGLFGDGYFGQSATNPDAERAGMLLL